MLKENSVSEVRTTQNEPEREQQIFTFKATQLVWLLFGILEAMIMLRIALKLLGANTETPIVSLIYGLTGIFLFPFTGLIGSPTTGAIELELSSVFAILIYALMAWAIERIVWLLFYRPRGPVATITETSISEHHTLP